MITASDLVRFFRKGPDQMIIRARIEGERVVFSGGLKGTHSIDASVSPIERVAAHFEGYCESNGCGLKVGTTIAYHTGNALRYVKVLSKPGDLSKTVLVSGFRYLGSGKMSKPRRIGKTEGRVVAQPDQPKLDDLVSKALQSKEVK